MLAAFAQTYSPLEIIISDDFSSDNTYAIILELAQAYRGPHRIITKRNDLNLGTAMHVQAVASITSGELLVVAAGDDVSMPNRIERIVSHWLTCCKRPVLLHSYISINNKNPLEVVKPPVIPSAKSNLDWFIETQRNPILSPTAAYATALFKNFPPLTGGSIIEDGPLVLRALQTGEIHAIHEPLVYQPPSHESAGRGYVISQYDRWHNFLRSKIISTFNKLQDIPHGTISTKAQRSKLERIFLRDLNYLAKCSYKRKPVLSVLDRVFVAIRIFLFYPNPTSLPRRLYFALSFAQLINFSKA